MLTLGSVFVRKCVEPHPCLDGPERVFCRLLSNLHLFRHAIEALLHGLQHAFVFPPFDPQISLPVVHLALSGQLWQAVVQ